MPVRTILAGIAGVAITAAAAMLFDLSALLLWCLLMGLCAIPMWSLEVLRHRGLERSLASESVDVSSAPNPYSRHLNGVLIVIILFYLSFELQIFFAGPQVGALPVIQPGFIAVMGVWAAGYLIAARKWQWGENGVVQLADCLVSTVRQGWPDARSAQVLLGWCVKAIFLPLMVGWSYIWLVEIESTLDGPAGLYRLYLIAMALLYAVDTAFATIGYVSTSARIGAHIRSVDRSWLGWGSALVCYPPLNTWVLGSWLAYKSSKDWYDWFSGHPWLAIPWGGGIIMLTSVYVWATVVFGPRFSNLTHRGIVTCGPYRWMKHPAYVSKNLSWWMISVPFLSSAGPREAIIHSLGLFGVNLIYATRAFTEERHLSWDPVYRQYCRWVEQNGLFNRFRVSRWSV